jgi:hypothetical protein
MSNLKSFIRHLLISCVLAGGASTSMAQVQTGMLNITSIRTGWSDDTFGVLTSQPIVNPAGCPTPDAYMTQIAYAGYKTHYAAALLAHASGKQVQITLHTTACFVGRPLIIAVQVW